MGHVDLNESREFAVAAANPFLQINRYPLRLRNAATLPAWECSLNQPNRLDQGGTRASGKAHSVHHLTCPLPVSGATLSYHGQTRLYPSGHTTAHDVHIGKTRFCQ